MAREFKDSGIEWIGQIPKEWEVNKIKYVSNSINKGNGITKEEVFADGDTPCVRYGEIYSKYNISFDHCFSATRKEIQKSPRYFNKGDILLAGTGELVDEIGKNIVYLGEDTCLAGGDIIVLSHNQSPSFLNYALNCHSSQAQKSRNKAKLKVVHISATEIGDIIIALPSIPIQQKIADYLDKVCGEVEEMVAIQETMIEELKAYKQSVITEAVTKGLNPNVPMRDSGIDWIGEIPEHWEQHQFRRIFEIKKIIAGTLGYDVLSVTQNGIKVKDLTKNEGQIAQDYSKYQLVDVDDYVMNHMDLLTGYVDCSRQNGVTSPDYRVFRAIDKSKISLAYYLKIFQTCYKEKIFYHLGQGVSGMGRWRLPAEQLKLFVLPMPPLSEQQQIASYLDTKCSEIDSLIALKQAKIEELKEYKKSVIYEYVTGKKEVV